MVGKSRSICPEYWKIEKTGMPYRYIIQYSYDEKEWYALRDSIKDYPLYFKGFKSAKSHLDKIIKLNSSDSLKKWV